MSIFGEMKVCKLMCGWWLVMFVDCNTVCFKTKTLPSDYNINIGRVPCPGRKVYCAHSSENKISKWLRCPILKTRRSPNCEKESTRYEIYEKWSNKLNYFSKIAHF